jgi:hypothetical protein
MHGLATAPMNVFFLFRFSPPQIPFGDFHSIKTGNALLLEWFGQQAQGKKSIS